MNDYPVFNPVNRAINIASGSVFSANSNVGNITPPPGNDYFELLSGEDFMLLDNTHFELL